MNKILVGSIPIMMKEGKILMLKRENIPFKGYWALPGGKIEFGEHPEETAAREMKEETGVDGKVKKVMGILSEVVKDKETGEDEWHFIMFICEMEMNHTEIKHSEEGELKWFDIKTLHEQEGIVPSDVHIIQKIIIKEEGIPVHKSRMTRDGMKYYFEAFGE